MDEYYHCRRTDCGCIATNSTWPSAVAAGGGQYWCPDPKLNCMRKYRAYPQMYAGQKLMESKKVMVFKDPYKEKGLTYQYCEWGSVFVRARVSHSAESQAMPCCATRLRR